MLAMLVASRSASGQTWNDARTRELVAQATQRRARQLADTGLTDYTATAHGYLTFLAQLGEGFPDPPKVVKADEIALEVYWRTPNSSKQWIVGRRDTLVLPTDIQYHRDHIGIVQNNFPNIIRLGDGDEVRDVPHPLSTPGMSAYDYAISDSLRFTIPGRTIDVYEVKVRPRDDRNAAAVGAIYIARDDAQVVRMAFSFTRAALIDRALEDVSIVLENSLIEGRFWLPRRQEIEIRRTGTWLEFPARGIIRGRWEICCYRVNVGHPASLFTGPEIVPAPPDRRAAHRFAGAILDSLPADVRAATAEEVERVQAEARALVRAAALSRTRQSSVVARGVSDFARVSRAEGLSLGIGARRRLGAGLDLAAAGRFGLSDHEPKGTVGAGWTNGTGLSMRLRAFREYREAGDAAEASGLRNSLAAQEFGSDYTDPFDVRGIELRLEGQTSGSGRWSLALSHLWSDSLSIAARPSRGRYEPLLPATPGRGPTLGASYERRPGEWPAGVRAGFRGSIRAGSLTPDTGERVTTWRLVAGIDLERPVGSTRVVVRSSGGAAWARGGPLPPQEQLFAGGPVTAPGYAFHAFRAARLLSVQSEWHVPVPFPSISLGRWGRIPGQASIVPLGGAVYSGDAAGSQSDRARWYPSLGVAFTGFFDLLRIDVVRGFRAVHGARGRWRLNIDVSRDLWGIL
jgi:hypothetical protein